MIILVIKNLIPSDKYKKKLSRKNLANSIKSKKHH